MIGRENIEEKIFQYFEGELSADESLELENFINNNPEYQIDFDSFISAFAWMSRIAMHAEKLDHHPEWRNIYNKVDVNLITHDKNTVTVKDLELAKIMDTFIEKN